jgi:hypothetical protein
MRSGWGETEHSGVCSRVIAAGVCGEAVVRRSASSDAQAHSNPKPMLSMRAVVRIARLS